MADPKQSVLPNTTADTPPAAATAAPARHVLLILNPVAGTLPSEQVRQVIDQHFSAAGWQYEIYETSGEDSFGTMVRRACDQGCDLVVAAGGDGTISAVAGALVDAPVVLGILPIGTANVLAQELGIPLDLDAACRLLVESHTTRPIDGMRVGELYSFLHIGIGLDALMIRDTERQHKRRFGVLAYIWTLFAQFFGYQPQRFTIVADGQRHRPRAAQVLLANGGMLGTPLLRWGPDIRPDDGRIDVCIVSARTLIDYLLVAWQLLSRQYGRTRRIRYLAARESIIINADQPVPIQVDGELHEEMPLMVRVHPAAIAVVVPPSAAASPDELHAQQREDEQRENEL